MEVGKWASDLILGLDANGPGVLSLLNPRLEIKQKVTTESHLPNEVQFHIKQHFHTKED